MPLKAIIEPIRQEGDLEPCRLNRPLASLPTEAGHPPLLLLHPLLLPTNINFMLTTVHFFIIHEKNVYEKMLVCAVQALAEGNDMKHCKRHNGPEG